jgi:hypothetical protein
LEEVEEEPEWNKNKEGEMTHVPVTKGWFIRRRITLKIVEERDIGGSCRFLVSLAFRQELWLSAGTLVVFVHL